MDVYRVGSSTDETPKKKKKKYFRYREGAWLVDMLTDDDDWLLHLLSKDREPEVKMKSEFCVRYLNYILDFHAFICAISARVGVNNHAFIISNI